MLSGGLDSRLAVCLLRAQDLPVQGVVFDSPFFNIAPAREAAVQLGIELHVVDFTGDILELLEAPRHGFGAGMNPCTDCHARMLRRAGERLAEWGCDFIATGEVLNQRPKSQNRKSLQIVAEESGYADLILRPLSARLLEATRPEREGWIERARLLDLQGRNRKAQMALAREFGLTHYPTPAGGCRLTEPNYCRRLADLKAHEGLKGMRGLQLLRVGRHFRLSDRVKLVLGRNAEENTQLAGCTELYDLQIAVEGVPGPTGLLPLAATEHDLAVAGALCARYSDCHGRPTEPVRLRVRSARGTRSIPVQPADPAALGLAPI